MGRSISLAVAKIRMKTQSAGFAGGRVLFALTGFALWSLLGCSGVSSVDQSRKECTLGQERVQNRIDLSFTIDNNDSTAFGFRLETEDQSMGPRSIARWSHWLFVTDPVHANVKRIDLETRAVITSRNFPHELDQIYFVGSTLVVGTRSETWIVMDTMMNVKRVFDTPGYLYAKDAIRIGNDSLQTYRPIEDVVQLEDRSYRVRITTIAMDGGASVDSLSMALEAFDTSVFNSFNDHYGGCEFVLLQRGPAQVLSNCYRCYEIPGPIPNTYEYYDCKNYCITETSISYFEISPGTMRVTALDY